MYILIQVVFCRPYQYTETGYLLSNKTFTCNNCRDIFKAWRWICRKQITTDFFISFSSYFCSSNGISALGVLSMSREIADIGFVDYCKDIYEEAFNCAFCEGLQNDFKARFADYSKVLV